MGGSSGGPGGNGGNAGSLGNAHDGAGGLGAGGGWGGGGGGGGGGNAGGGSGGGAHGDASGGSNFSGYNGGGWGNSGSPGGTGWGGDLGGYGTAGEMSGGAGGAGMAGYGGGGLAGVAGSGWGGGGGYAGRQPGIIGQGTSFGSPGLLPGYSRNPATGAISLAGAAPTPEARQARNYAVSKARATMSPQQFNAFIASDFMANPTAPRLGLAEMQGSYMGPGFQTSTPRGNFVGGQNMGYAGPSGNPAGLMGGIGMMSGNQRSNSAAKGGRGDQGVSRDSKGGFGGTSRAGMRF